MSERTNQESEKQRTLAREALGRTRVACGVLAHEGLWRDAGNVQQLLRDARRTALELAEALARVGAARAAEAGDGVVTTPDEERAAEERTIWLARWQVLGEELAQRAARGEAVLAKVEAAARQSASASEEGPDEA